MAQHQYYPEDVLVEKIERGEYGWLDYVNHFSAEWQEEYTRYCEDRSLPRKALSGATRPCP